MHRLLAAAITLVVAYAVIQGALNVLADPAARPAASCHAHDGLPDARCTPGARDGHVTQSDIGRTICRTGYTATVRPPSSYTTDLKHRQLAAYGYYAGHSLRSYEEDHLISLELGGSPRSEKNLWPEAHAPKPGSYEKDSVENHLHREVCARQITLAAAQHEEAHDWVVVYRHMRH